MILAATILLLALAATPSPGLAPRVNLDDRVTRITCELADAYNDGRLLADQYARIFAMRTEAAELVTRWGHFRDTGDPRAGQAGHEATAAVAVAMMATRGIE